LLVILDMFLPIWNPRESFSRDASIFDFLPVFLDDSTMPFDFLVEIRSSPRFRLVLSHERVTLIMSSTLTKTTFLSFHDFDERNILGPF
jgi:hypothetical protein